MKINRLDEPKEIPKTAVVKVKETGNITEIMMSEKRSAGGYIRKISKDEYADIRTGEVSKFKHSEKRIDDTATVAKSLAKGRDLLNANITDVSKCRWVTLTYAENMKDPKRLYDDFEECVRRLRKRFGQFEYITAAEPQSRGAWHLHAVFMFPHEAPFMPNEVVRDCWKQGFVNVRKLQNVDNIGAYLTAYLGNMELTELPAGEAPKGKIVEIECLDDDGNKVKKKVIKGARMHFYPAGFHIFRKSKGIKSPTETLMMYEKAMELVGNAEKTYSQSVHLEDEQSDYENTITKEYYNKQRKKVSNNDRK